MFLKFSQCTLLISPCLESKIEDMLTFNESDVVNNELMVQT